MLALLGRILPLDIASTISPGLLAISVILLSSKVRPKEKLIIFFIGSFLSGVIVTAIGYSIGQSVIAGSANSPASAITDLIIGVLCLYFGILSFLDKPKSRKVRNEAPRHVGIKIFIVALIANLTNLDAVFLNMAAAKEVATASIAEVEKYILLLMNIVFFTLPISLPCILYSSMPRQAQSLLARLNAFLTKYGRLIVGVIFIIMAIVFIHRGFKLDRRF